MKSTVFEVTLSKTFVYAKGMLEKGYEHEDAINKAHNDIYKSVNEIANNKFEDVNTREMFKSSVVVNKGFKVNATTVSTPTPIQEIIDRLATAEVEKIYGVLDLEDNPSLFDYIAPMQQLTFDGTIRHTEERWVFNPNVQKSFNDAHQKYSMILNNFLADNSTVRRPQRRTPRRDEGPTLRDTELPMEEDNFVPQFDEEDDEL